LPKLQQKFRNLLREPTFQAIILILLITIVAAIVVANSEAHQNSQFTSFWDSVWWVMVTISTVGYGDKVPVTPVGKITAALIMLFGIALLSIITATISSIFVTRKIREGKGLQEIKVKDHILLCGWNEQAEQILSNLERAADFTKILVLINQLPEDEAAEIITRYDSLGLKFVRGDFTRENILNRAKAKAATAAIVLPDKSSGSVKPGDERTLLATLSLKTLNPKIKVYAHIQERENLTHLRKAHADEVILSDAHTGFILANHVLAPGVPQFLEQLFSEKAAFRLKRQRIPAEWAGKNYGTWEEHYRRQNNGILLGLGQATEPFQISDLMSDDYSYLDDFIMRKFKEAGLGMKSEDQIKILINPPKETMLNKNDFYLSIEKESE